MAYRTDVAAEELWKFDPHAHAVTVISEPHRLAHDGMVFHASGKHAALADAGELDILIATSAYCYPHIQRMSLNLGRGDVDIETYEGTTTSAQGAAITSTNTNRNSSNTPCVVLTSNPTVTDVGTLVHTQWVPPTSTGVGQTANGISNVTQGEEWILAPSTQYMTRITNNSGAEIALRWEFLWYEISYDASFNRGN